MLRFLLPFVLIAAPALAETVSAPPLASVPAPAADPDPVVTLKLSELRALIELGVAQYRAAPAQEKIQAQIKK